MDDTICPKCATTMEEGFIMSEKEGGGSPSLFPFWIKPDTRNWERRPVATFCCPACGYLEFYAKVDGNS